MTAIPVHDIAFPTFEQRAPWRGADLQTLRNFLTPSATDLSSFEWRRIELPTSEGDRLQGVLSRPAGSDKPLVILLHGLSGCEDSSYIRASARHFLDAGWPVLRANMRGAGPSRSTCARHYHAGRSEDLRATLRGLSDSATTNGVVLMAFSLGANQMLKTMGEESAERALVRAAISVSAPIDLARSSRQFLRPRNSLYHHWLLARMKEESTAPGAELNRRERAAIEGARTVYQFDNDFVAPRHGFSDAEDYYAQSSALPYLQSIPVPTLLLHATDDPWIPVASYERHDWTVNPNLRTIIAPGGGHVGFHGRGSLTPWHDRCALRFLDALFEM
jgi:hypothetical protein